MTVKKEVVKSIKGFDKDLKCSGFQFEFGKTYEQEGDIVACKNGFHAVEGHPLEVFKYHAPGQSRYAEVKQSGALTRQSGNSRLASAKITIGVELHLHDLIHRAVKWVFDKATPENTERATGDYGAASSTGIRGAASSTGDYGAASSTGAQGAAMASGYKGAASSTGNYGAASSTDDYGAASSTGDYGAAMASGYKGAASSTGNYGAAMASGYKGAAMGEKDNALFLVHRNDDYEITHAWAGIAGRDGIKAMTWYTLNSHGRPEEVK